MKTRLLFVPLLLTLALSLAACGGGSQHVPANAVAVVDGTSITTAEFNQWLDAAIHLAVKGGQPQPQAGSPQYIALRDQTLAYLVRFLEFKQQAQKEGVSVSPGEVTKYLKDTAQTRYGGSMTKYAAALKKDGLSMNLAREEVLQNLLSQKLYTKVTSGAKVPTAQEQAFYKTNIAQYNTPASTTRNVEYILVKSKGLANSIEHKLQSGASFANMAKQYSIDKTTAPTGGKFTVTKGGVVPAFDSATFALKTGQLSAPVDATSAANRNYGWFIIEPLGPPQTTKAHVLSFKEAEPQIKQSLLQQAQYKLATQWLADLAKEYQGKVSYQSGYAPPTTTAVSTSQAVTTG